MRHQFTTFRRPSLRELCACSSVVNPHTREKGEPEMNSIIYVVGLVVVVLFVAGYLGLR